MSNDSLTKNPEIELQTNLSIEPSLRHISHQLDRIIIDTQNIKSDLALIKLYIDIQKKDKLIPSNDEISKGWFW